MTQQALLVSLTHRLQQAGIPHAAFEGKQLCYAALQTDATGYLLHALDSVSTETADAAEKMLLRRIGGEPLQYILGQWSFLDDTFFVGPGVLIPRPETEELVLQCETLLRGRRAPVIIDLCAGSGCIGLSLQKLVPEAQVYLVEYSDDALCYLQKNAAHLGLDDKVHILRGDILRGAGAFPGLPQADLIVSNPPYIRADEIDCLQREVQREPRMALDGGEDGLTFYRCFASCWKSKLKEDGCFAFECGEGQGSRIASLFEDVGFHSTITYDFNGFDRFVIVSRSRKDQL